MYMNKTRQNNMTGEGRKQLIYNLMNGYYDLTKVNIPESRIVENEFDDGKPCSELYERVYEARERLCERLGVEEDPDVEAIVNNMEEISRILAMKMFDYAVNKELSGQK